MRHYYQAIFPEGARKAQAQFRAVEKLLLENPFLGHKTHKEGVYEYSIPRSPFSYIYQVKPNYIAVLRVWDERQAR